MKSSYIALALMGAIASPATRAADPGGRHGSDYVQHFDTLYNSLTIERRDSVIELRARSRRGEALESAVDLADPLRLVVDYTRTLYAGLFFEAQPKRVLMIGLGGAGFHRMFAAAYPDALLQTVELDPKVVELCEKWMAFTPTAKTPVAVMDGRMFVKRDKQTWDWIILDAFRGGFVPPHLKTEEFYRECAARLGDRGVFISNLHATTDLYYSDVKTIQKVFPQVVLFATKGKGNVIACAVKYSTPDVTDPAKWPAVASLIRPPFEGRLDLEQVRAEQSPLPPAAKMKAAKVLTDDFAPVEFLDTIKANNTTER
jgi:spermidine synthase